MIKFFMTERDIERIREEEREKMREQRWNDERFENFGRELDYLRKRINDLENTVYTRTAVPTNLHGEALRSEGNTCEKPPCY